MQFLPESRTPYPSYFDPTSQTQYSQYPAYSEIIPDDRSSASAYTSQPYGSYPLDSRVGYTGADFGPIYAKLGYTPPPEPYDSPTQSRSGNPQCTSSTLYATRVNTQYNKTSGLRREDSMSSALYNSPGYAKQHPLPPQAKGAPYSNMLPPRLVPQKTPLAVPPDPNLPPIPGTPMTVFLNRSSANASLRESEANDDNNNNAAGLTNGWKTENDETRVRFRSPLVSVQGSFSFEGSDKEVEKPLSSAAEASGSSFTARISPISSEYGRSKETEY